MTRIGEVADLSNVSSTQTILVSKEAKPKAKRTVKGFYFCGWLGGGGGGGVGGWKEARGVVASLLHPTRIRMDVILISRSSV